MNDLVTIVDGPYIGVTHVLFVVRRQHIFLTYGVTGFINGSANNPVMKMPGV